MSSKANELRTLTIDDEGNARFIWSDDLADMLDLGDPRLDWVSMAQGMGVPAERATTAEEFDAAMARAMAGKGPAFIEAVLG